MLLFAVLLICFDCISKYSAKELHIHHEKAEVVSFNKDYISAFEISLNRINDTLNSLTSKTHIIKDIENCIMEFDMAQLKDGEYNHDKLTFEFNCCDFLESDWNVYRSHSIDGDHGNLPEHCENEKFPKNDYWIKDALMDESPNISLFKLGKWRADFRMNSGKTNLLRLYFYSHVTEK